MILRRITEQVKSQNWVAVGIEFVIVVVGVFVGLQAQDWSTARAERSAEQAAIERLIIEYKLNLELLDKDKEKKPENDGSHRTATGHDLAVTCRSHCRRSSGTDFPGLSDKSKIYSDTWYDQFLGGLRRLTINTRSRHSKNAYSMAHDGAGAD